VAQLHAQFRLSEALKTIYSLIWDDFCSWYLEWIKPNFGENMDAETFVKTIYFFEELLQLLHPYMPFITEEIYHLLKEQKEDLCVKQFAETGAVDASVLQRGELLKTAVSAIRDARNKNNVKPKETVGLQIQTENKNLFNGILPVLRKQINAETIGFTDAPIDNNVVVAIEKDKFFLQLNRQIDKDALRNDLLKDLEYQQKFLQSVLKKLNNERFVQNAKPEVVAVERKKQSDAEARIRTIEESLENLING
jgi:valyl-tRNA synthetase